MIGIEPILSTAVPVGDVHVAPDGLQSPRTTGPPVLKGRYGSGVAGTVMVNRMFEGFTTLTAMLVSVTTNPLTTMPTVVF